MGRFYEKSKIKGQKSKSHPILFSSFALLIPFFISVPVFSL
jgi:hypothetical protein